MLHWCNLRVEHYYYELLGILGNHIYSTDPFMHCVPIVLIGCILAEKKKPTEQYCRLKGEQNVDIIVVHLQSQTLLLL